MSDVLDVIKRLVDEHQTVRQNLKLVGDKVSDREALTSLESARADWVPGQQQLLVEKREKLRQTLSMLDEGLRNHFAFEEQSLPPLLGGLLMRGLIIEHQEMKETIREAQSLVGASQLEGLKREELLAQEMKIRQKVSDLCQMVEEHAGKEDMFLAMMQRALEGAV